MSRKRHEKATYLVRQSVPKYAHAANISEVVENEYNLNIPRYVDTFEEEEQIDIGAVQVEIDGLKGELAEVEEKMAGYLKELRYAN